MIDGGYGDVGSPANVVMMEGGNGDDRSPAIVVIIDGGYGDYGSPAILDPGIHFGIADCSCSGS